MPERITDALEVKGHQWGQTAAFKEDVQELSDLPSEHALKLAEHDWRLVRFNAAAQPSPKMLPDVILSIGKPAYRVVAAEWAQRLPSDTHDEIEAFDNTAVGPLLHMMRTGIYIDEGIDHATLFELCDANDIEGNAFPESYFSSYQRERHGHIFEEEAVSKILLPEEFAAIDGLYVALADASQELLDIRQPA